MTQTHTLKTIEPYFTQIWNREKLFEWRLNDRDFQVGDKLQLVLTPVKGFYSRWVIAEVGLVVQGAFNIPDGYCILQLKPETMQNREEPLWE